MKAEQFVDRLRAAAPSREELASFGLSPDDTDAIRSIYRCPETGARPPPGASEAERLHTLFDCSRVEVSYVRLDVQSVTETPLGTTIGAWEADPIVFRPDGQVVVVDHGDTSRVIFPVAHSAEAFLDALIVVAETPKQNAAERASALRKCIDAAGGDEFSGLWKALLG